MEDFCQTAPAGVFNLTNAPASVIIVVQACLIFFLWMRRRSSSCWSLPHYLLKRRQRRQRNAIAHKNIDPLPRHGGDLVAEALVQHGVQHVFCLAGGHISPILVGCQRRKIRVVDVRHEVNAVFAADAVSRMSRDHQVGVAVVTAGPGVTNTLTAIQNAYMAQSPLLLLGGATLGLLKDRGSLQDIDQQNFFETCIKWQAQVTKVADIIPTLEEAFYQATQVGAPGPVFVELPLDALYPETFIRDQAMAKFQGKTGLVNKMTLWYLSYFFDCLYGRGVEQEAPSVPWIAESYPTASDGDIQRAVSILANAKKPLLVVGSQAVMIRKDFTNILNGTHGNKNDNHKSKPTATLDQVVHALGTIGIPSFLAGGARGCLGVDTIHSLDGDKVTTTDTPAAKWHIRHKRGAALKQADVVVLLGVPCDFRLNYGYVFRRHTQVISVNLDAKLLYLNKRPTLAIHGDVPDFIIRLEQALRYKLPPNSSGTSPTHPMPLSSQSQHVRDVWESWRLQLQQECDKRDIEIQQQSKVSLEPVSTNTSSDTTMNVCNPLSICLHLNQCLGDNSILVCDGGDFIGTAAYTVRPRQPLSWLDPGPFGTLGVGAGFALGAKMVRPEATVWLLWGDGSAAYSLMEYDTFVRHKVTGVVGVIGNDACWRQIHRDQIQTFDQEDVGCMLAYSDYQNVVEALGGKGYRVSREQHMKAVIDKAKEESKTKPVLINVMIGKTNFREGSISV